MVSGECLLNLSQEIIKNNHQVYLLLEFYRIVIAGEMS